MVLVFFPAAFSRVCTCELCTFRDRMALLERADAAMAGISTNSSFCLAEFKRANRISFTLLSDYNQEAVRMYGVMLDDLLGLKGLVKRGPHSCAGRHYRVDMGER